LLVRTLAIGGCPRVFLDAIQASNLLRQSEIGVSPLYFEKKFESRFFLWEFLDLRLPKSLKLE
jgi:hypothetical protein